MKPINLILKKFGRLTVVRYDVKSAKTGHAYWVCSCECGRTKSVRSSHLKDGNIISCGCYASEISSKILKKYATSDAHKGSGNPSWKGDNATYATFHDWLSSHNVKKSLCEHCNKKKRLDWALKQGKKYSRNVEDYLCLCRSCHLKYDYTPERKDKISKFFKGRKRYATEGK